LFRRTSTQIREADGEFPQSTLEITRGHNANPFSAKQPRCRSRERLVAIYPSIVELYWLSGHSQQIDDICFAFEGPRIGLYEAMIDCNLADLAKLVFANADISKAAR
jgi:hypothetical protein